MSQQYWAKEFFDYYLTYAKSKGIPRRIAKDTKDALQYALERADPGQQIEHVFDRVLMKVWNPVKTIRLHKAGKLPPMPLSPFDDPVIPAVDAFERLRKQMNWASAEQIRAEGILQATEIKPSEGFIDWFHGALDRYFKALDQCQAQAINSKLDGFLDKFKYAGEMWAGEGVQKDVKAELEEAVHVCTCHATEPLDRFVDKVYDPSTQFDTDLHMRTSFTNRLKAVDWNYHLQAD